MKKCFLTIVSAVDGKENTFSYEAELKLSASSAVLRYGEEGGETELCFEKGEARIERKGDYGLSLCLKEGKRTAGTLSVAGSDGKIEVQAARVGYFIGKNSLLAFLKYSMLFENEIQEMSLRIKASCEHSEEK